MKMKSKIISLTMASMLMFSMAGLSFADAIPFTDLNEIPAKEKILVLQEKGIVKGIGENLFAPNHSITAAQGVQLIVNTLGLNIDNVRFIKAPKATDYFKNADDDAWYADAFIIVSVNGIGLPSDLQPEQKWTREEFTYYLIKALEIHKNLPMIKIIPEEITDQDQITSEYSGSIQRALFYGIVQLDGDGKFKPKDTITRAEAAEQIYNTLEYLKL